MKIFILHKKSMILISIIFIMSLITILFFTFCQANSSSDSINLMNKILNHYNKDEKIAFLTFDDGPSSDVTPKILDILKSENIKATFFVIGKSVDAHPNIIKREYEDGHYIANHSYSHNSSILYKSSKNFKDEIIKTDLAISNAIGVENYCSHVFRFPNGFMSNNYKYKKKEDVTLLSEMNYFYLDWNCVNNDSLKKCSTSQLLSTFKRTCNNKNIIVVLMHDTKDVNDSSLVLKDSISYLKSQGYTFGDLNSIM